MNKIPSGRKLLRGGTRHRTYNRGFSLVEILVVVLIMGILVGVVGSLLGGFITTFEITDDQSIARRRAADVFNILQNPMLYAGMGIPADHFGYYFNPTDSPDPLSRAPIWEWSGPVWATSGGSRLQVVYAVPAGLKNKNEVDEFSEDGSGIGKLELSGNVQTLIANGEIIAGNGNYGDMRSYVTFPGIRMHPVAVRSLAAGSTTDIDVVGRASQAIPDVEDPIPRNMIRPYHDMYLVRAGVAFVDNNSTFYLADITNNVNPGNNPDGFRVEGIKAIHFEPASRDVELSDGTTRKHITGMRVYVIAEGDNFITGRNVGTESSASQAFRSEPRWDGLTFDDEMYYEEFQMQWRTRNVEAPETL